ncbi:MAG: ABC transporter substrate-binding protein [Synergistaceae bacterium]|jgi:NitT/TauT family transport system substrate-binding protein|nr:ABC transporter substrate-binding protein [Synergistaceae bacterium]
MKKIVRNAMLLMAFILMSAIPAQSAEKLAVVRVGVMAGENDSFIPPLGEELGIFKKYGLEVKSQVFSAGINTIDALTLGQLDFGMAADFAILNRIGGVKKSDLRIYTKLSLSLAGNPFSWQVYVNDESVKSPSDLSGKSIAIRKGTVEEYWTARLIEVAKIGPNSVKLVPIGSPQEGVVAVKSKQVTGMWAAGQATIELRGIQGINTIADLKTINAQTVTVLLSTEKFLRENKETVVKYIKAMDEIVNFILTEPEKTAEIVQKRLNIPAEQVLVNLQRNELSINFTQDTIDTLDNINKWGRESGFIKNNFNARDYVDVDALKEAFPDRVSYK